GAAGARALGGSRAAAPSAGPPKLQASPTLPLRTACPSSRQNAYTNGANQGRLIQAPVMVATITGAWINLPWFAPFVYAFCLELGQAVLSGNVGLAWSFGGPADGAAALLPPSARAPAA